MKVSLRGVRGSIPTTGADTAHFGGNTSCVIVSEKDWFLVLDGGSGMRNFYLPDNIATKRVDILLTHLHFDHIQGLGFFNPFFNPSMEVHIWGPGSAAQSLHSRLSRYLSPPLFPVLIRDLPCKLKMHEVENSTFEIGPFTIQSAYVIHPGPTVGYRVTANGAVFTYIPDHEPALGLTGMLTDVRWVSGSDLALNADLLLHDAQFTTEEYIKKIGWGHSSIEDAIKFASLSGVKHLLLAHHDPFHTDTQLREIFAKFTGDESTNLDYELAVEGMQFELPE